VVRTLRRSRNYLRRRNLITSRIFANFSLNCVENSLNGKASHKCREFLRISEKNKATTELFERIIGLQPPSGACPRLKHISGAFVVIIRERGRSIPIGLLALTKDGPLSIFGRFGNSSRFCYGFAFARIASPYPQFAPMVISVTIALYRAWTGERYAGQDGREKA
jgi:hypothetical protein